jgi:hypothetical protein
MKEFASYIVSPFDSLQLASAAALPPGLAHLSNNPRHTLWTWTQRLDDSLLFPMENRLAVHPFDHVQSVSKMIT